MLSCRPHLPAQVRGLGSGGCTQRESCRSEKRRKGVQVRRLLLSEGGFFFGPGLTVLSIKPPASM